jgi:6-phosphogluconolactonase (cycloisomerase 2 family)
MRQATLMKRVAVGTVGVLIALGGCSDDRALGPTSDGTAIRDGATAALAPISTASPTSLAFLATGAAYAQSFTLNVGIPSALSAASSNPAVATVSPATTARLRRGQLATFTVTPAGDGSCTITVTSRQIDGKPNTATVAVTVNSNPGPLLYAANFGTNSVAIYPANGNTPIAQIQGSNTGINFPAGIALDGSGKLYVTNPSGSSGSVTVYAAHASGNATPIATISGSNTGLNYPAAVAVDGSGTLYVANANGHTITVYPAGANGNASPTATISGSHTGLLGPDGVALGSGNLYVANYGTNSITVYAAAATGDETPAATISGTGTGLNGPRGLALASGNLYVANGANSITAYAAGASGNASPTVTISGSSTGLSFPAAVAVDGSGNRYVANQGGGITIYAAAATGNASPTATIVSGLNVPQGVALLP